MAESAVTLQEQATARHYSLITAVLLWCGLAVVSSLYITIPMVSVFADVFDAPPSLAAWTGSAFSFAYAIGFLFFGPLTDRFGKKQMMLFGLIALCIISPMLGFADNLPLLIGLRALQGLVAASFSPAVLSYAVETFPADKRVTAIGFISTGFLLAGIAGQVFSSIVSHSFGWPYVFYFLGAIYLISALLLGGLIPRGDIQKGVHLLSPFKQMGGLFLRKPLFFCYLTSVTLLLSFVGMYTTLGSYLSQQPFELDRSQILLVRSADILGMLLSPFAGRLVGKFGTKKVLQAGLALAVAGLVFIGISFNLPFAVIMSIVFVAGISITVPTLISLIGSLGGEARGAAVTLYTFILFFGATIGPIAALSLLKTGSYIAAFEGLAAVLGLGLVSTFFIRIGAK